MTMLLIMMFIFLFFQVLKELMSNLRHARGRARTARTVGSRELAKQAAARQHLEARVEAEAGNMAECQRRLHASKALAQERSGATVSVQERLDEALASNAGLAAEVERIQADFGASQIEVHRSYLPCTGPWTWFVYVNMLLINYSLLSRYRVSPPRTKRCGSN